MSKRFKKIYVEISNICNLNCSFCPITERDKDIMKVEDFEKTLTQVSPLTDLICLHLMGEPLAHPKLSEIFAIASQYPVKIELTTNGILLKKFQSLILNSSCIHQVNISLQSYLDNYPNADLSEYLENICIFIDQCLEHKPEIYINLRLWNIKNDQGHENEQVFSFLEKKYGIDIKREVDVGAIKSKKLFKKLYLNFDSRFEWPRSENPFLSKQGRCKALIDHIAIHADGSVVPCCLDDQKIINLGNVNEQKLEIILESDRAQRIKKGFLENVLIEDLCQKCSYIRRFSK